MGVTIQEAIQAQEARLTWAINKGNEIPASWVEHEQIRLDALKEKAEREDPKPLTFEEMMQMDGQPVWVQQQTGKSGWCVVLKWRYKDRFTALIPGCSGFWHNSEDYEMTWIAYRSKPKEVTRC